MPNQCEAVALIVALIGHDGSQLVSLASRP